MIFLDLVPIKKFYFLVLFVISCVLFFYAYKYKDKDEYKYPLGAAGILIFGFSLYVLLNPDNKKTCDPKLWKVKTNVILPSSIGDPDKTDMSLCQAQTYAQYEKSAKGFYFTGSNVYILDDLSDTVNVSSSNTNVSFYYLKDEKIKTSGGVVATTTTSSTVTTTSSSGTGTCCYRNPDDSCTTFENTYLGRLISDSIKNAFVNNKAGTLLPGGLEYIGDFTLLNSLNNTTSFIVDDILMSSSSPISPPSVMSPSSSTETVRIPSFSWPDCVPDSVKAFTPKMKKSLDQRLIKIVTIDSHLVSAILQLNIFIARNGSRNTFTLVRGGPWSKPMEIQSNTTNGIVIRYNSTSYILKNELNALRNLLIAE